MKKCWIYAIILLSLYSCGSYTLQTNKGYNVESILAITEAGDTISVPYSKFVNDRYDNYMRFNFNDAWYWNSWNYNYNWRFNYGSWNYPYYWGWNNRFNYFSAPSRPVVKPKTRVRVNGPRGRINQPRLNENNSNNIRITPPTQTGSNGRRSWNREIVPNQPTRPGFITPSQPRQIRGGSQQPRIQQTQPRGSSRQQGSRGNGRRQN